MENFRLVLQRTRSSIWPKSFSKSDQQKNHQHQSNSSSSSSSNNSSKGSNSCSNVEMSSIADDAKKLQQINFVNLIHKKKYFLYTSVAAVSLLFIVCLSVRCAIQSDDTYRADLLQLPSLQPVYTFEDWLQIRQSIVNTMNDLKHWLQTEHGTIIHHDHGYARGHDRGHHHQRHNATTSSSYRHRTQDHHVHVAFSNISLKGLPSFEINDVAINTHTNLISVLLTFNHLQLEGNYKLNATRFQDNHSSSSPSSSSFAFKGINLTDTGAFNGTSLVNHSSIANFQHQSSLDQAGCFQFNASQWKLTWFGKLYRFSSAELMMNEEADEPQQHPHALQLYNIELYSFFDIHRSKLYLQPASSKTPSIRSKRSSDRLNPTQSTSHQTTNSPTAADDHLTTMSFTSSTPTASPNLRQTSQQEINSYTTASILPSAEYYQPPLLATTLSSSTNASSNQQAANTSSDHQLIPQLYKQLQDEQLYQLIQESAKQRMLELIEQTVAKFLYTRLRCKDASGNYCDLPSKQSSSLPASSVHANDQQQSTMINAFASNNSGPKIEFFDHDLEDVLHTDAKSLPNLAKKFQSNGLGIKSTTEQPLTDEYLSEQMDMIEQSIRNHFDGNLESILNRALLDMHRERNSALQHQFQQQLHHQHQHQPHQLPNINPFGWNADTHSQAGHVPFEPIDDMNGDTSDSDAAETADEINSETLNEQLESRRTKRQVPCERGQELDEYVDSLFRFASRVLRAMEPFGLPNATVDLPEYNMKIFLHSGGATRAYTIQRKRSAWVYCSNESVSLGLTLGFDDLRVKYKYRAIKDWSLLWDGELEAKLEHTKLQVQFTQTTPDEDEEIPVMQRIDRIRIWRLGHVRVMIKGLGNLTQGVSMLLTNMLNQNIAQLDPTLRRLEAEGVEIANRLLKNITIPFFSII